MATTIIVPRLGWSMEEGTFAGWLKVDGERIKPGDVLFVLESDKSAEEIESLDAGILRIPPDGPQPGDKVTVGQVLAHLLAEGEAVPEIHVEKTVEVASVVIAPPITSPTVQRKQAISPRARRVARELGIDCNGLTGSGRNGRIRERDIRAATAGSSGGRLIPHTNIRRTIAARMVAGVTQAAPVTLTTKFDATNLVALRNQFKAADEIIPSFTDLIVKLTAVALRQHPLLQAQWRDDGLFVPERIDIAVAVDTEAGLLVPVLRAVNNQTLRQIVAQSRELIEQTRAGRLSADQMRDATFTITNLGGVGIDAFTPILYLPQCAVLGVGRIVREPAVQGDRIVPRDMLTLSLTFDHRVVDGAPAAQFLQTLRICLEQPAPWLIA
ncbi:MAG TPA: dihydrolipoamide acetyltransferase family protein [Gemmataceae bacterium]|nr:dihydrolipoamide acetyltransferase family protein [Gemmataceae bacterium]